MRAPGGKFAGSVAFGRAPAPEALPLPRFLLRAGGGPGGQGALQARRDAEGAASSLGARAVPSTDRTPGQKSSSAPRGTRPTAGPLTEGKMASVGKAKATQGMLGSPEDAAAAVRGAGSNGRRRLCMIEQMVPGGKFAGSVVFGRAPAPETLLLPQFLQVGGRGGGGGGGGGDGGVDGCGGGGGGCRAERLGKFGRRGSGPALLESADLNHLNRAAGQVAACPLAEQAEVGNVPSACVCVYAG